MQTIPEDPKPSRKPIALFLAANCAIIAAVAIALVFLLGNSSPSSHPAPADLTSQAPIRQPLPRPVPSSDNPAQSRPSSPRLPGLPNFPSIPTPSQPLSPPTRPQPDRLPPGNPELFRAVWTGDIDEAERLLQAGAQANVSDEDGDPFLREAIWRGHPEIVILLIQAGADVNAKGANGDSLLKVARFYRDPEIEQALLAAGAAE